MAEETSPIGSQTVPHNPPATMPLPPRNDGDPEMFSKTYVHELREEAKTYRLKAEDARRSADEAKAVADKALADAKAVQDKATADLAAAQEAVTKSANDRVIRAELKAEAIRAGMVDLDGLKLADLSTVTLSDDGNVVGASEMLAKLKEAKPYLFSTAFAHSSQPLPPPPPPGKVPPKSAREMTKDEYAAAKKALLTQR